MLQRMLQNEIRPRKIFDTAWRKVWDFVLSGDLTVWRFKVCPLEGVIWGDSSSCCQSAALYMIEDKLLVCVDEGVQHAG